MANNTQDFYKTIKIAGIMTFVALVIAAGPLSGFFLGDFLMKHFNWKWPILLICIGAGFLASLLEVIRLVRLAQKFDKEPRH
ncbi:MAG: AtpZ/AtpI family protein [Candidatus Omnitrophica bacterium]|nr:AtpZ/AtpI family protein [Candidatus Omnitrophota bacterium]